MHLLLSFHYTRENSHHGGCFESPGLISSSTCMHTLIACNKEEQSLKVNHVRMIKDKTLQFFSFEQATTLY